jgi:hypothetical protein
MNADTSAFILTPSCLARADNRACMLFGIRAMNFPLAGSPGAGISLPAARIASIHALTASLPD